MPTWNGLHVPKDVAKRVRAEQEKHHPGYPPTTRLPCGSDSKRQSVGDPGHCEACATFGHVAAHPDFGCGDVGCDADH